MPTSTSVGGDACIAVGIDSIEGLKGKNTWDSKNPFPNSPFERALIAKGMNPADFPFKNQDPAVAATGMQASQARLRIDYGLEPIRPANVATTKRGQGTVRLFKYS